MSFCHFDKFSKKGGKCPTVILTSFHKKEENVHRSFMQVFNNRRKMSFCHFDKFSKKGGKCPMDILKKISQKGGKCPTVILTSFHNKEENVSWTF
jgi:hypothetical protein